MQTRIEAIHCNYRNKTDSCGERQCHILSSLQVIGLLYSFSLRDNHDVAKRIASTNASMGAMSAFWDENHVDIYSKYLIFRAIPCNLLLWGCDIWALRQTIFDALEVFLHRSVRRILKIKVRRVNPIRIESCESFRMRAEAFISECLAITNDSNGSGIIKCE